MPASRKWYTMFVGCGVARIAEAYVRQSNYLKNETSENVIARILFHLEQQKQTTLRPS